MIITLSLSLSLSLSLPPTPVSVFFSFSPPSFPHWYIHVILTNEVISLGIGDRIRVSLQTVHDYRILVNTISSDSSDLSSFSIQVHSQLYNVSLTNDTESCSQTGTPGCTAYGSNVGLVQVWNGDMTVFPFRVAVTCEDGKRCPENVTVLIATVGIPTKS